jgi:hypothetical protein
LVRTRRLWLSNCGEDSAPLVILNQKILPECADHLLDPDTESIHAMDNLRR